MKGLEQYIDDDTSLNELMEIKQQNKQRLAEYLRLTQNEFLDPSSIFDVQVKRLHEYKRQLLNVLHIMYLYNRLLSDPSFDPIPRTFIFGAKAASGYRRAKAVIKLINTVADRINNDRRVRGRLRIVLLKLQVVSPSDFSAAMSEQIACGKSPGTEEIYVNGALPLGNLTAQIEIVQEAGAENEFVFGLKADDIIRMENEHSYNPQECLERNPALAQVVEQLVDGTFDPSRLIFKELHDSLIYGVEGQRPDVYYVLADFDAYCEAQERVGAAYKDKKKWARMSLENIAHSGKFSSDRTIEEYVRDIWKLKKVVVE